MTKHNRYTLIIEEIFNQRYRPGDFEVTFDRLDLIQASEKLGVKLPKNLGDVLYSFRYRAELPDTIVQKAPQGFEWIIRPAGRSRYTFALVSQAVVTPNPILVETKIPDATPGVIYRYALNDEQALLARIRYNRLIDIFTGLACYSLQNHLRTAIPEIGQAEIDEVYIGIDRRGVHYVLPVQAKVGNDKVGIVQIEQDQVVCAAKFPGLVCRSIAAQMMQGALIALFEFEKTAEGVRVSEEKHYKLVPAENLTMEELEAYQRRSE